MGNWEITYNGTTKTTAEWGLVGLSRTSRSMATGLLTFVADGAPIDSDPVFPYGSTIELFRVEDNGDRVREFYGRVTRTPAEGSAVREAILYEVADVWWYLEHIGYQQTWLTWDGSGLSPSYKGRILLGYDKDGNKVSTNTLLTEVLEFAISRGAPFQIGTIEPNIQIPAKELEDLTCAEVIVQIMRWHPDSVCWIDQRTSPTPTIHIKRRASLPAINISAGAEGFEIGEMGISPRYDLQVPAVVIKYETIHQTDNAEYEEINIDKYPPAANAEQIGVLPLTVSLQGSSRSTIKQKVKAETIDVNSANWWRRKLNLVGAQGAKYTEFTVSNGQLLDDDGNAVTGGLDRELIEGTIADWMANVEQISATAVAEITYTFDPGGGNPVVKKTNQEFSFKLRATNAQTRTYQQETDYTPGEPVPTGVAQTLYESLTELQYEGQLTLIEDEATRRQFLGSVINITGAKASWETMRALVVDVREDLDNGATTVVFGPARYLGAGDLIEIFRQNRGRRTFSSARLGGNSSAGQPEAGDKLPEGNTASIDNKTMTFELEPSSGSGNGIKVAVDSLPSSLPEGVEIKPRWVYGCDASGNRTRALAMISQEFPVEEE